MKKSVIITVIAVVAALAALAVGFIFGKISTTNVDTDPENYLDMSTVVDWESSDNGLMLYTDDGNGYYWER